MFVRIIELESADRSRLSDLGLQRLEGQVVGRMPNIEKRGSHCAWFESSKVVEEGTMLCRRSMRPMALFMIFAQISNTNMQGGLLSTE